MTAKEGFREGQGNSSPLHTSPTPHQHHTNELVGHLAIPSRERPNRAAPAFAADASWEGVR